MTVSSEHQAAICLRAWVGLPDGSAWISDELDGDARDPEMLGHTVATRLKLAGAGEILGRAEVDGSQVAPPLGPQAGVC